jgi:hypothetical protein
MLGAETTNGARAPCSLFFLKKMKIGIQVLKKFLAKILGLDVKPENNKSNNLSNFKNVHSLSHTDPPFG